jgi:hypothetical protein
MTQLSSQSRVRGIALIAAAICALGLGAALLWAGVAGASGETVLTLEPAGEARAGQLITLRLVARNAQDLAGFQGVVQYDQAGLRLTGASVDGGLGRGGRGVMPLGPVMGDGSVALGAATCPIRDCASLQAQLAARAERGVSGRVELGTLEFYGAAPGSYSLSLEGVQFVDPQGNRLEVRAEPLLLEVRAP